MTKSQQIELDNINFWVEQLANHEDKNDKKGQAMTAMIQFCADKLGQLSN
jgi:hypothetical protein